MCLPPFHPIYFFSLAILLLFNLAFCFNASHWKCFFVQPNLKKVIKQTVKAYINTASQYRRWIDLLSKYRGSQQYFLFYWLQWMPNFSTRKRNKQRMNEWKSEIEYVCEVCNIKKFQTGKEIFTIEHIYRQAELLIALHSLDNICRFRIRKMPKKQTATTITATSAQQQ